MSEQNNNFDEQTPKTEAEQEQIQEQVQEPAREPAQEPVQTPAQEPVTPPLAEEKKKPQVKKWLVLGVAAIVVIGLVAVLLSSVFAGSPTEQVFMAVGNTFEAMNDNEALKTLGDTFTGGSLEISADLEDLEEMIGSEMEGRVSAKIYTDLNKKEMAVEANAEIEDLDKLDLLFVLGEKDVAVSSHALLGRDSYGINLKKAAKNFEKSVFGIDGEYSLGIESIEEYTEQIEGSEKLGKDVETVLNDAMSALAKSIEANAQVEKDSDKLEFNGENVRTTKVEIVVDAPAMLAIAMDMMDWAEKSKDLPRVLEALEPYYQSRYGMYEDTEDVTLVDTFYEELEYFREELEDLAAEMEDAEGAIEMTFHISKSGKYLVAAELVLVDGSQDDEMRIEIMAGPSLKDLRELSVVYDDGWSKYKVSYLVDEDKDTYIGKLKVREDNEAILSGKVEWEKDSGEFEIAMTDSWDDEYGAEGELYQKSGSTVLYLDSVTAESERLPLGIQLTLTPGDKVPSMPSYTDILTMDEDEIEDLLEELEEAAWDWGEELSEFLYW